MHHYRLEYVDEKQIQIEMSYFDARWENSFSERHHLQQEGEWRLVEKWVLTRLEDGENSGKMCPQYQYCVGWLLLLNLKKDLGSKQFFVFFPSMHPLLVVEER